MAYEKRNFKKLHQLIEQSKGISTPQKCKNTPFFKE